MKIRRLILFLIIFHATSFSSNPEWIARIIFGTTLSACGVFINGFITYKDFYNLGSPGYNSFAFNVKKIGLMLQYGGDWVKYKATRNQVFAISTTTTLTILLLIYYRLHNCD